MHVLGSRSGSRSFRIGRGLFGLLMLSSLLACSSGACNIDLDSFNEPEKPPALGLTRSEEDVLVVVVPRCADVVSRIALVDSSKNIMWDVRALSAVQLEPTFEIGDAPKVFFDVKVPLTASLDPKESYQVVIGAAPTGDESRSNLTTTTASTAPTSVPEGSVGSEPSTTATTVTNVPTTESELFDEAVAVGSFAPEQVEAGTILVGRTKVGLGDFEKEACNDPDATTTTTR